MMHFYRNVFSHVPATKIREVSHMLKSIHAQESRDAADKKARAIDNLRASKMNTAADLVEQSVHETLTYYAFPDIHLLEAWSDKRYMNMRPLYQQLAQTGAAAA
jgi:putative transposase